jgi:hypothetical protein
LNSYMQQPVDFNEFRGMVENPGVYWRPVNHHARGREFSSTAETK